MISFVDIFPLSLQPLRKTFSGEMKRELILSQLFECFIDTKSIHKYQTLIFSQNFEAYRLHQAVAYKSRREIVKALC